MFRELAAAAIEALLHEEVVARIAYIDAEGRPCIVPTTFAYDGRSIYGYSLPGSKIENMAARPEVCVEVEHVEDAANWQSVMLHGVFEPLEGPAAAAAVARISDRLRTVAAATNAPLMAWRTFVTRAGGSGIAYRIRVTGKTGRCSIS